MSPLKLSIALVLGLGSSMAVNTAKAESMASVVERVIQNNPTVGSAYFNSKSSGMAVELANALRKPKVSLSAQTGVNKNRGKQNGTYGASLNLSQRLYDGGEEASQIRKSRADLSAAESRYEDAILATCLLTIQTYIEVQRSRQILDIAQKNLASMLDLEKIVRQRANAGFASQADVYQAKSTVAGEREQLFAAKQLRDDATSDFAILAGNLPDVLDSVGAPNSAIPPTADESVMLALKHSPRLIAMSYEVLAAYASYDGAKSAGSPKMNLNMRVNYDASAGGVDYSELSSTAEIAVRFDLYDGGEKKARKKQAAYVAREIQQNALREKLTTERDVRRIWNVVVNSHAKLANISQRVNAIRQSYSLNLQRFKAGKADISLLLNLQAELAASRSSYVNEQATSRYNTFRMLAATGRLPVAMNLDASKLGFSP